jgi:hypothetical protein
MKQEFTEENNDGRCSFCDEKEELDHTITAASPQGITTFAACMSCCKEFITDKLSERVARALESAAAITAPQALSDEDWEREAR